KASVADNDPGSCRGREMVAGSPGGADVTIGENKTVAGDGEAGSAVLASYGRPGSVIKSQQGLDRVLTNEHVSGYGRASVTDDRMRITLLVTPLIWVVFVINLPAV